MLHPERKGASAGGRRERSRDTAVERQEAAITPTEITMTTSAKQIFITGLRNAHAMETQAREMMERQSERLDDYPDVKQKVRQHLAETQTQLGRLEECLKSCGESTSTMKDTAQSFMGNLAAMAHAVAPDEILKNTFANNAFEHYEIAAYKSLLALCSAANAANCRPLLEANLREEEAMAKWVDQNVEKVTASYLTRETRTAA
jgi:ferritin-like metal-binding protein YciE